MHAECGDLEQRRALDRLVGDRASGRAENEVDERAVLVPGLAQPALRRALGAEPGLLHSLQRRVGVLRPDHEVDVVLALGAAPCPGGEPAPQDEGDLVALERPCARLHRVEQLLERRLRHRGVVSGLSNRAT